MCLNYELTQFLNHMQAGEPLTIYMRWGTSVMLLQNFTSDRTLLLLQFTEPFLDFHRMSARDSPKSN